MPTHGFTVGYFRILPLGEFKAEVVYISHALGGGAGEGMAQIASQTGLSWEQLYRSFSEKGNPTLKTTLAVMKALRVQLTAKPSAVSL